MRRSNSLTPPVSLCQSTELWTSQVGFSVGIPESHSICQFHYIKYFQDDLCAKQKPRSFSLSSEHCPPLSPQSSQASSGSGSETQLDETKSFNSDFPGMRGKQRETAVSLSTFTSHLTLILFSPDVGTWLKALRLHKYIWLFAQLSYDEMLALTEEKLEALGVTKGARHKIILSIKKLKDRYNTLCQLEKVCFNLSFYYFTDISFSSSFGPGFLVKITVVLFFYMLHILFFLF